MKTLKFLLFLSLIALFLGVFFVVLEVDKNDVFEISEMDSKHQTFQNSSQKDILAIDTLNQHVTSIFDVKVVVDQNLLTIFQLEEEQLSKKLPFDNFAYILSSDLNTDENPEFWLVFKQNKKAKFLGFSWEKGKLIHLNFPQIKGRQQIGYIGNDSLYLEKGLLVREFKFANDPYAELTNGYRKCFYAFGQDRSFILKKTIDYEK